MRKSFFFAALSAAFLAMPTSALAKVSARVDLSKQRMIVSENGVVTNTWKISSGKRNHITPNGSFKPTWVKKMHYSKQYDNAPMPYTVFFHKGYAVHGTGATWRLGSPASHGCVRLKTSNAKKFYDIVKKHGQKNVSIKVVGTTKLRKIRVAKKNYRKTKKRTVSWNRPARVRRKAPVRVYRHRANAHYGDSLLSWF